MCSTTNVKYFVFHCYSLQYHRKYFKLALISLSQYWFEFSISSSFYLFDFFFLHSLFACTCFSFITFRELSIDFSGFVLARKWEEWIRIDAFAYIKWKSRAKNVKQKQFVKFISFALSDKQQIKHTLALDSVIYHTHTRLIFSHSNITEIDINNLQHV